MKTITLYHDPVQGMLHTIESKVQADGSHQVVMSVIHSVVATYNLRKTAIFWSERVGEANVRAYTISPVEF